MSIVVDYPTYSSARDHFKDVLDATDAGRSVTVAREGNLSVVFPIEKVRSYFFQSVSPRVRIFVEAGVTVALMEERPFLAEGASVDDALADLMLVLREYAVDWESRLKDAPNHEQNWALVQLIKLSTDEQLRDWFERGGE
jgi:hypothetical protein